MNALALPPEFEPRVSRNEPMSRHTSWHVGGPADLFFTPSDAADLAAFLQSLEPGTPILWIGLGSNLLVRDGGVRGAVIDTHGVFDGLERLNDNEVWCGSGVACAKLAKQCVKWGLGPAEFFAGIPGTLGGALAMNAGAFGGETWNHVLEVATLDRCGVRRTRSPAGYNVGYRHVVGPANEWFLGAKLRFELKPGVSAEDIRILLARRKATQPIGEWSCGSVFTNPQGDHAARLIDSAGLKGCRIGGARVSEMHANFIVNDGAATAADIERLIEHVQATVERVHGVRLTPEVRMVGERAPSLSLPRTAEEGTHRSAAEPAPRTSEEGTHGSGFEPAPRTSGEGTHGSGAEPAPRTSGEGTHGSGAEPAPRTSGEGTQDMRAATQGSGPLPRTTGEGQGGGDS